MTIEEWAVRFYGGLTPALAALQQCEDTCDRQWAPALVAHADQLRAASRGLSRWAGEYPCPDRDLGLELSQLARSYSNAADLIGDALGSGVLWLSVTREVQELHRIVARVLRHYESIVAAFR